MNALTTGWFILVIVAGYKGVDLWWIFGFAVIATLIYLRMRRENFVQFVAAGRSVVVRWIVTTYALEVVTVSIAYFIGYGMAHVVAKL